VVPWRGMVRAASCMSSIVRIFRSAEEVASSRLGVTTVASGNRCSRMTGAASCCIRASPLAAIMTGVHDEIGQAELSHHAGDRPNDRPRGEHPGLHRVRPRYPPGRHGAAPR